jgi:hypothetical protein
MEYLLKRVSWTAALGDKEQEAARQRKILLIRKRYSLLLRVTLQMGEVG